MKKFGLNSMVVAIAATFALFSCSEEETTPQLQDDQVLVDFSSQEIEGQYIVIYNTDKTGHAARKFSGDYARANQYVRNQTQEMIESHHITSSEIVSVFSQTVNGATLRLSDQAVEKLKADDRIAYIEKDRMVMLAPPPGKGPGGGDGGSTGQEVPWGIARVNGVSSYSGSGVAWIIDTGIDLDHPDLNVDASRGFNAFTSGKDAKSLDDGNGHGSHVAGTVAALNNDIGVIGVAPGATVIPVKVLDSRGSGSYSGVISGVDYVAASGSNGDVANMSLGGPVSEALDDAVKAAASNGILFSLAAGNESDDANNHSPARANGTNIYTISAMSEGDIWASFSNYSNPPIDYCAPGVSVKSTWKDGGYNTISGTSMAAPHAAGVLLLGNYSTSGNVSGDPDGDADAIIVH